MRQCEAKKGQAKEERVTLGHFTFGFTDFTDNSTRDKCVLPYISYTICIQDKAKELLQSIPDKQRSNRSRNYQVPKEMSAC